MRRLIAHLVSRRVRELEAALVLERYGRMVADQRVARVHAAGKLLAHRLVEARAESDRLHAAAEREVASR